MAIVMEKFVPNAGWPFDLTELLIEIYWYNNWTWSPATLTQMGAQLLS